MAKMIDVARHAGVSVKTVSRVLNNEPHVQEKLRVKVREAVRDLGYVPSASARSLRSNRTYSIHMVSHTLRSSFVHAIQFGAQQACQDAGYQMIVSMLSHETTDSAEKFENWCQDIVQAGKPDGIILVPPLSNDPMISEVMNRFDLRAVRVGPNTVEDANATVMIDDRAAARDAVNHLIELGHKRIAYVRGKEEQDATHERYKGYCDALDAAGLEVDERLVKPGVFSFESGLKAGDELLGADQPPTAVFAANDDMAAGVLVSAHRHGISIPAQLSIIGFDDSEIAEKMWPSLSTIRQPLHELGEEAARVLVKMAGQKTPPTVGVTSCLPYEIVVRQSTGPAS